jgi:hypothetical protein
VRHQYLRYSGKFCLGREQCLGIVAHQLRVDRSACIIDAERRFAAAATDRCRIVKCASVLMD